MKKIPIRVKITMWFSAVLIFIVLLTFAIVISVSHSVMQKNLRTVLVDTVENNVDEVEYYKTIGDIELDYDADRYIEYKDGYIEVDDDFLDNVNGIFTSLYMSDGTLFYGDNPVAKETIGLDFKNAEVQKVESGNETYYVLDRKLSGTGLEGLWLRGVVSENQGNAQISDTVKASMISIAVVFLIAVAGGYLIARKLLKPIKQINDVANEIGESGDINKRINLGDGKDELHELANTFDNMFDKIEESFEAERRFTSDASHELRTPMAVIMAQCELALDEPMEKEEYVESIEVIQRQGKKMTNLISDMLDVTRLERKTDKYQKEDTDFSAVVKSVCEDLALIKENNITLKYNIKPNIIVSGNRQLLSRLVINLLNNAYRYGKENGHIFVSLDDENDVAVLCVKDDGIGIAEDEKEKIFKRFYQVDTSHEGNGTGLGLSMVKEIATFHDGKIDVDSIVGEGSTFKIYIPLKK